MTGTEREDRGLDLWLLDDFLALSPDAMIAVDEGGRILAANQLAADLFGYRGDELLGAEMELLVSERLRAAHREHRGDYAASPRARRMGENLDLWGRRADGTEFPVDVSLAPVAGPAGLVVIAAVRDMATRREEQLALAELAAIVQSTDDAVIGMTVEGVISSWNPGAAALLGYESSEVVGQPISLIMAADDVDDARAARERVLAADRIERFESWRRRKDGREVEVEVTLSPIRDRTGALVGIAAVLRDLTELRQVQEELAESQRQHERFVMLADRERIARDLHDLVIQRIFAAGMALRGASKLAARPEAISRIDAVIDELDTTITEIRSSIFELEHHGVGGGGLRSQILHLISEAENTLGHQVVLRISGPVNTAVSEAVGVQLLAALREALSNIARHAQASATEVDINVTDEVILSVVDNGIGMSGATRTSGLRNLRHRAEALGGSLALGQPPPGGTTLEWRVPTSA